MTNPLKLGILYKNGVIVNHRSLLKILINPILRYFGYYIGTIYENKKIKGLTFRKGQKENRISYSLETNEYDTIIRKRILF